ncbi:acyl-phosphate glycerol 3-phosphate acyltransferase [Paenibacillus helianthi]|uniref:Glycerol-3-phosphate acyltransferase n=1 Tax=Paenibacillus helianthi TaxID=1349432 RepID=A0ABX3ER29_9BACL|nr:MULTISPECIES: glycerol-3-phosphate 1-O-acyltransferase PlsY [Paenibacillus]OKP75406.1 acyl-phosphate glycerol 3-phosphate acyltransferase [Paenibacillus sp. P3E]OKP84436.1 acyl-phosphate glycerol 3-phosphate acyltransferase [Paenibacillus sp. P32E]OKP86751.1 acyl-phosphate glycerol 3-phosphate acyltransferase [Paenibacillus helianthi]
MAFELLVIVVSYLLGSVSFSVLLVRLLKGVDIRQYGSGNAGATNTLRVMGKGPAILVLVLDVLKGIAAVWLGTWAGGWGTWVAVACGIAAIIGHNWPLYFHFRGGKGIATTIGVMATLCFWPALIAGIVAIVAIVITKYVSLGSLLFVALTPVILIFTDFTAPELWGSLIIALFAFWRHRSNIVKISQGRENKIGSKVKEGNRVV